MRSKSRASSGKMYATFEGSTRILRWASIALVLFTFPFNAPQARHIYIVLLVAALYNCVRYIPAFHRLKLVSSPAVMLAIDTIFAGVVIALVGNIATPYSAILVLMIINAAYLYQLTGVIAVAVMQAAILFIVSSGNFVEPVELGNVRLVVITVCALILLGYLVSSLTRGDKQERDALLNLREKSDREKLRLHALVDSLNVAIFVTDDSGEIVEHNEAGRVLSRTSDSLLGKDFSHIIPLHPRGSSSNKTVNILKQTGSAQHRRDLSFVTKEKRLIDLDISVTPVEDKDGKTHEYIIVCEDITTERSLEDQREEFISVASHELRTPLAILEAALGSALSAKDKLPEETAKLIGQAHRNAILLGGIIKDITTLAEAQNDNLPIQLTRINPRELLDELQKDFIAQAEHRGLKLVVHVSKDTPEVLSTKRYIQEILQNYITNALKYSDTGTVTISAAPGHDDSALFSVRDQGIGISPKDKRQLFTKFFRAEDYRTRTTGGTGLGLYLCMEIAQRMGARLWCDSTLNEGSTFYLEVPPFSNLKQDQGEIVEAQLTSLVDQL